MPVHPQVARLLAAPGRGPMHEVGVAGGRDAARELNRRLAPGPDVVVVPGASGPVPVRRYGSAATPGAGVVVYLHGGGWVVGDLDYGDAACRHLAAASGCEVVNVDYRLAPEHRWPAAVDDAYGVLSRERTGSRPVAVVGESAGGNLAAVCARRARDAGMTLALQALICPVTDFDMGRASYEEPEANVLLSARDMAWFAEQYAPDPESRADPDLAPLCAADLSGLAPALIHVARFDPLREEGLAYAAALEHAGVPVDLRVHEDMVHAFTRFVGLVDRAEETLTEIGRAVGATLQRQSTSSSISPG